MIRRKEEMKRIPRPQMRGGDGTVFLDEILRPEELMGHGRMFSLVTLEPGCSVGEHSHTGEAELFYILDGEVQGTDDDVSVSLYPGDLMVTGHGHRHSVRNNGFKAVHILALILSGDHQF